MKFDDIKAIIVGIVVLLMVGFLFGFGSWTAWKMVGLL